MCSNRECLAESIAAAGAGHRFSGIGAGAGRQSDLAARPAPVVITSLKVMFLAVIVSALARGLNIECGCFGTMGGKHIGLFNLAIDSKLFILAALLARRSRDCPANKIFRKAGAQNSTTPLEASPKASSAPERGSRPFAGDDTLR
jgi:hypothetical protein